MVQNSKINLWRWTQIWWPLVNFVVLDTCMHRYNETCTKRPLTFLVSQDRWSFMIGRMNMLLPRFIQLYIQMTKFIKILFRRLSQSQYRFNCMASRLLLVLLHWSAVICWRSGWREFKIVAPCDCARGINLEGVCTPSLATGKCSSNFKSIILKLNNIQNDTSRSCHMNVM